MSPLDATNASFIMGFIVFVSSRQDTPSQYGKGHNISVSRLRYSANQSTSHSQNDELCKNRCVSERRSKEEQQ